MDTKQDGYNLALEHFIALPTASTSSRNSSQPNYLAYIKSKYCRASTVPVNDEILSAWMVDFSLSGIDLNLDHDQRVLGSDIESSCEIDTHVPMTDDEARMPGLFGAPFGDIEELSLPPASLGGRIASIGQRDYPQILENNYTIGDEDDGRDLSIVFYDPTRQSGADSPENDK